MTLEEVATVLGISRARVWQIEVRALETFMQRLAAELLATPGGRALALELSGGDLSRWESPPEVNSRGKYLRHRK